MYDSTKRETTAYYRRLGSAELPRFSHIRVMHMPLLLGNADSARGAVSEDWLTTLQELMALVPEHHGEVGYLTSDERRVRAGESHRRPGLHVDGVFEGRGGGWGGGGGGGWGSKSNGLLTVSNHEGCRVWPCAAEKTGHDGGCEDLRDVVGRQFGDGHVLVPGAVYWMGGMTVHESMPQACDVDRQFVRLSLPAPGSPWFEGYTRNPNGVQPSGPTLPRRWQMDL